MEKKYTKGKWVFDDTGIFSLNKEENEPEQMIAYNPIPYSSINTEWEANALLISKAPEMLEMLVEIRNQIEDGRTYITKDDINQLIKSATEI
jgi:hypothetical protein